MTKLPKFDCGAPVKSLLLSEPKAVDECLAGSQKARNYLYGKIQKIQYADLRFSDGRPITMGHMMDPGDIWKYIDNSIKVIRGLPQ